MKNGEKDPIVRKNDRFCRRMMCGCMIMVLVFPLLAAGVGIILAREYKLILARIPDTRFAIRLTVDISVDEPVLVSVDVPGLLNIPVKHDLTVSLPLREVLSVPINENIRILMSEPVRCRLDHPIRIQEDVPIQGLLPLNTRVNTSILGIPTEIPVKGSIPIDMVFPLDQVIHIKDEVMVRLTEPVDINITHSLSLPVDLTVRTTIPIDETISVALQEPVVCKARVEDKIPVMIDIEVVIDWSRGITINGKELIIL